MSPKIPLRVLILEDRPEDAELMMRALDRSGFECQWRRVDSEADFLAHLDQPPDVILADYTLPELGAARALELVKDRRLEAPFIVVSGSIAEETAVAMIRQGAADYLLKDRLARLGPAVKRALEEGTLARDKARAEQDLRASEARFHAFMRHSPVLAFIRDEAGRVAYVNHPSAEGAMIVAQLPACPPVEDSPARSIEEVTTGDAWRQMLCYRFVFRDAAGRPLVGGVAADITEQKAAEQALSEALAAKDVLLREVHHRVKNNLQTISSLLHMQSEMLGDAPEGHALRDAERRVHSMALIHEQMYGDKDMAEVDFGEYARRLARDLLDSFGEQAARVRLRFAVQSVTLSMDQMIPCGLIVNEWITNSLKYAFPENRRGEILVSLRCAHNGAVTLGVADDGVGFTARGAAGRTSSLGTRIVGILAQQLGGKLGQQNQDGVRSTLTFTRAIRGASLAPP